MRPLGALIGLTTLNISSCWRLADVAALSALVSVNLQTLELSDCILLDHAGALSTLVGLRTIDLSGTCQQRDALPLPSVEGLLDVGGCKLQRNVGCTVGEALCDRTEIP